MKYAIVFGAVTVALLYFATQVPLWAGVVVASAALAFGGVSVAYFGVGPRVFLKRVDGTLHPLSYVLFWPVHLLNFVSLWFFRRSTRERLWAEVGPNLYLGPRLDEASAKALMGQGVTAVLDLAAELPETRTFRILPGYRSLPTLDTRCPAAADLDAIIEWVDERRNEGSVYVHCALGHGRSATVVAGCLLRGGQVSSVAEAAERLKQLRAGVELKSAQVAVLNLLFSDFGNCSPVD